MVWVLGNLGSRSLRPSQSPLEFVYIWSYFEMTAPNNFSTVSYSKEHFPDCFLTICYKRNHTIMEPIVLDFRLNISAYDTSPNTIVSKGSLLEHLLSHIPQFSMLSQIPSILILVHLLIKSHQCGCRKCKFDHMEQLYM